MARLPLLLALLSLLLAPASAVADSDAFCGGACDNSLGLTHFVDAGKGDSWHQRCSSLLRFQSVYLCLGVHCDGADARARAVDDIGHTCRDFEGLDVPPYDIVANFTDDRIASLPRINTTDPPPGKFWDEPVLPSDDLYTTWYRTLDAVEYVHHYHFSYSVAMVAFWIVVVAVGTTHRALVYVETRAFGRMGHQNRAVRWFRRNISTPATFGKRCTQDVGGWCTIPTRIQSITIALFVVLNVACSVHGYRIFPGNVYFPTETKQVLRYVSDRTGIISFANFPLIWLFGMRNNVVMWLTGWDFGTFNKFHRWVARVATLQAVIHSVGYTIILFREGGWTYFAWWWTMMFFWAGELATIFMCALLALSVFWLRRKHYETFLIIHIGMSILILATMLGHVSIFRGEYDALVWVPVLIWVLDRVIRLGRVLVMFGSSRWSTRARATLNPSSNIIRLEVALSPKRAKAQPGTYYYLMLLNGPNFWESHPFTVAYPESSSLKTVSEDETTALLSGADATDAQDDELDGSRFMTFLIRPYDGFTSRLRDMAEAQWPKPAMLKMAVDGPYGGTLPLQYFDNVVFIVGGSGVVVPMAYSQRLTADCSNPPNVYIHWSVREAAFIHEVQKDFAPLLEYPNIYISIHQTAGGGPLTDSQSIDSRFITMPGRLDVARSVREAASSADQGSLAVVACGPAPMADEARRATVEVMGSRTNRIEYFEESFQW